MTLEAYENLIDGAYAILEPDLSGYAADDPLLLRMISVASGAVQNWLGRRFESGEVATLPEEIKTATAKLTAVFLAAGGSDGFTSERLGDYQYTRENWGIPRNIQAMLEAYRLGTAYPFVG